MSGLLNLKSVDLDPNKKYKGFRINDLLYLALLEPVTEVYRAAYLGAVKRVLKKDPRKMNRVLGAANSKKQQLLRLETSRGEKPWWAPIMISKGTMEKKKNKTKIFVAVLLPEPTKVNHY